MQFEDSSDAGQVQACVEEPTDLPEAVEVVVAVAAGATADAVLEMIRFVLPANLLDLLAACVPTGITNGLPVGAQAIAPRLREDVCLDLAGVMEGELGVFTLIDQR